MRKRIEHHPNEPTPAPRLLTVMQVAAALGVGKDTVYGLIKHEGLPAVSVGLVGTRQKLRISVASLERWIKEREQISPGGPGELPIGQTDAVKPKRKRLARSAPAAARGEIIALPSKQASAPSS